MHLHVQPPLYYVINYEHRNKTYAVLQYIIDYVKRYEIFPQPQLHHIENIHKITKENGKSILPYSTNGYVKRNNVLS